MKKDFKVEVDLATLAIGIIGILLAIALVFMLAGCSKDSPAQPTPLPMYNHGTIENGADLFQTNPRQITTYYHKDIAINITGETISFYTQYDNDNGNLPVAALVITLKDDELLKVVQ